MARHKQAHPRRHKGRVHGLMVRELARSGRMTLPQADAVAADCIKMLRTIIGEAAYSAQLGGRPGCITVRDIALALRLHDPQPGRPATKHNI